MPVITGSSHTAGAVARLLIIPVLVLAASCGDVRGGRLSPLLRELSDHAAARAVSGRLSVSSEHRACAETGAGPDGSAIPRCHIPAPPPDPELLTFASRVSARVVEGAESEVLHAAGLIEMLWGGGEGNSLDQSISYLSGAARLSDEPAPALADLAAAYLARAEQGQYASDLLEALEAASRAVEAEPGNRAARFNLALVLERLGLERGAGEEWRNYLVLDSESGWAREAEERLRRIGSARRTVPTFPVTGTPAEAEAFAAESPQDARFFGWDEGLGAWGAAVLRRDSVEAGRRLALAAMLGEALEARGGDASLAAAVQAIRGASGDTAAVLSLARGHRGLLAGRVAFREQRWEEARDSLAKALEGRPPSPVLHSWLRATYAMALLSLGQAAEAGRIFKEIAAGIDESRYPALAGQARWGLATMLVRQGNYDWSLQMADTAAALFARAGERRNVAFLLYLAADIQFASGARTAGYESMRQALSILRHLEETIPLHNLLVVSAAAVAADGFGSAAIRIQNEGVAVADSLGRLSSAEAVLRRAPLRAAVGDTAGAGQDLMLGAHLVRGIESVSVRRWLENERRITRAALSSRNQPEQTIAVLDSVLATPGGPGTQIRMLRALVSRAEARLEMGATVHALADLDSATSLMAAQPGVLAGTPLRTSLLDAARGVFDRLVMLAVNAGDATRSLEFMERGRVSFSSTGTVASAGSPGGVAGATTLEYALIGDTLLIWVVADKGVVLSRSTIDGTALKRTIERSRAALEFGERSETTRADLSSLHRWLIGPVGAHLRETEKPLVIVADGEISGAPFPALLNTGTGRYLVQDHPMRFAPSIRDAAEPGPRKLGPPSHGLFVGDPGNGTARVAGLSALPGAEREVLAIASLYPDARVLTGTAVAPATLAEEISLAHVFHFAGHAIFNDRNPERSFLVIDPQEFRAGGGRLSVEDLGEMDLSHIRLVVLSACETMRSHDGRSGGFSGFSAALFRAGVGGVVGSMWRVDDAATARLMVEFHREYVSTGDGPGSLRSAQLRLLGSDDPLFRSPSAWAGFRYAGN